MYYSLYSVHGLKIHISYSVAIFLYDQCIAQICSCKQNKKKVNLIRQGYIIYTNSA